MEDFRSRRVTTVRQLELLLNFLEQHRDLALGRVRSKEARALSARLWEECAGILNAEGPFRDAKEWSRFWNDYKSRVRSKVINIAKSQRGTGGGPAANILLTPIEERVSSIIGRDVGPIPGVQQDPFAVIDPPHTGDDSSAEDSTADVANQIIIEGGPSQPLEIAAEVEVEHTPTSADQLPPTRNQQTPPPLNRSRRARNTLPRPRSTVQRSNREALEESRSAIARVEVLRANTERLLAECMLKLAEAANRHEQVMERIAQSFQIMAEAVDRMSRSQR